MRIRSAGNGEPGVNGGEITYRGRIATARMANLRALLSKLGAWWKETK